MLKSRYSSLAGLDIGSSAVKVVQLSDVDKAPKLEGVAVVPIDPDADPDAATINAIKEAVRQAELTTDRVASSVAGPAVAVRNLEFLKLTSVELEGAVYWEGSQVIPFNMEDVYTDFQVLPGRKDGPEEKIGVLFIAASKKLIDDRFKWIHRSGLIPRVVDIDALAMLNCFQNGREDQSEHLHADDSTTALLNIGARFTNLVVINSSSIPFNRDIMIAGNNFTTAIEKASGVSFKEADRLKKQAHNRRKSDMSSTEDRAIMEPVFSTLVDEIRRSFEYFQSKEDGHKVDRILLGGGASRTFNLKEFISEELGLPVDVWDPLQNIETDRRELVELAPLLTVATGLALRKDPL